MEELYGNDEKMMKHAKEVMQKKARGKKHQSFCYAYTDIPADHARTPVQWNDGPNA